ncbi:hypothetical protein [Acrocarpospora phusangensis]|nr:hypothetical protein [Acrocarpospora phusangensis]
MRAAGLRRLTWSALLVITAACGQERPVVATSPTPAAPEISVTASPSRSWEFEATVELGDGRRVGMGYWPSQGLFEQHYDPKTGEWTEPRFIYRTRTDACQSIKLQVSGDTVTAIADFGRYCSDGEPPTESIAAVAAGDLRSWDHHVTKNFDGWSRVAVADGGRKATFSRRATVVRASLVWTRSGGFGDPVFVYSQ